MNHSHSLMFVIRFLYDHLNSCLCLDRISKRNKHIYISIYLYTPVYLIESVKIMKIWYCKTYFFISLIQLSCKIHAILKRMSFFFITENGQDFYPGYQGYNDFFPGQGDGGPPPMNFLPPTSQGTPPLSMEQSLHHNSKYILRLSNSC